MSLVEMDLKRDEKILIRIHTEGGDSNERS